MRIRQFQERDLDFGIQLSTAAGWNQTPIDWLRQYRLDPIGCFVAESGTQLMGTVASSRFDHIGWVAMMLVADEFRRRGAGRALMKAAIEYLESCGVHSIRLDATSMGEPLYRSLGFECDMQIDRYDGTPVPSPAEELDCKNATVRLLEQPTVDVVSRIDEAAYGYDRRSVLDLLCERNNGVEHYCTDDVDAYAMSRPGRCARFLGPCIAAEPTTGGLLLDALCRRWADRRVMIDIPCENLAACDIATGHGLLPSRRLLRMTRGVPCRDHENSNMIFATSGPENG